MGQKTRDDDMRSERRDRNKEGEKVLFESGRGGRLCSAWAKNGDGRAELNKKNATSGLGVVRQRWKVAESKEDMRTSWSKMQEGATVNQGHRPRKKKRFIKRKVTEEGYNREKKELCDPGKKSVGKKDGRMKRRAAGGGGTGETAYLMLRNHWIISQNEKRGKLGGWSLFDNERGDMYFRNSFGEDEKKSIFLFGGNRGFGAVGR